MIGTLRGHLRTEKGLRVPKEIYRLYQEEFQKGK